MNDCKARTWRRHLLAFALVAAVPCSAIAVDEAAKAPTVVNLDIANATVPAAQRLIRVTQGDQLSLRITSDAPGQLHVHAYRVEARVVPGQTAQVLIKAFATGRFRVEWHPAAGTSAATGAQHAPALAMLEVLPQ